MKKLLFCLFLSAIALVKAQNDDCTGAISLTVGTDFASGAITANNNGATTDGSLPSCDPNAVGNVWFKVVVPQSGSLKIQIKEAAGSLFNNSALTVYSGTCGSFTEIGCNSNGFLQIKLTGQSPGSTLYISVWKFNSAISSGEFQISAYDPLPPVNNDCLQASPLTVGTDFASGATTSNNDGATTDGPVPSCDQAATENVWFKVVVPQSGNLKIQTKGFAGSLFDNPAFTVYSGTCGSLNEIGCNFGFSQINLTGQNPGDILYISVWKFNSFPPSGEFQISAYDPLPPANDNCSQATPLTVGTNFTSGAITSNNDGATTDGPIPSCDPYAIENVWFKAVVPQSGNLKIQIKQITGSLLISPVFSVYSGTCGSLNEIGCRENSFSSITLTGQTPGNTVYISVWKLDSSTNNGEFQISTYDPAFPANDNCSQATPLTVGTDFASGAITSSNDEATTDGPIPSCDPGAIENVWFKAVVPQSGNLKIQIKQVSGSMFYNAALTVYNGTCGALNEIDCNVYGFSQISLTGQNPGDILYISVWKLDSYTNNGEFQISAYDPAPLANDNCSQATSLTVGTDFASGAITANNEGVTTDGTEPSCYPDATENVWFKAVVPQSGNLKIQIKEITGSPFYNPVLTVYSGTCGSLTEIECNNYGFSQINLTGQNPGDTLYISLWKHDDNVGSGEFQISAYDNTTLSTQETTANNKKISVHPNPFSDTLTLSDISDIKSVFITDISGRLIKTIEKPTPSLHLKDLKAGLYFITLKMKDGSVKTIKTIKK